MCVISTLKGAIIIPFIGPLLISLVVPGAIVQKQSALLVPFTMPVHFNYGVYVMNVL